MRLPRPEADRSADTSAQVGETPAPYTVSTYLNLQYSVDVLSSTCLQGCLYRRALGDIKKAKWAIPYVIYLS